MGKPTYLFIHKDHPLDPTGPNGGAQMAPLLIARCLASRGERVVFAAQLIGGERREPNLEFWDLGPAYDTPTIIRRARSLGDYCLIANGRAQSLVEAGHEEGCKVRLLAAHDRSPSNTGLTATTLMNVADGVICVSEAHRHEFVSQGADPDRVFVAYNGADLDTFCATDPSVRDYTKIVFAGALVPDKGIHLLIHSFIALKREFPGLTLDVYGSSGLWGRAPIFNERELEASIPGLKFFGARPHREIAAAYGRAGLAVVPSIWFECFPLTAIEAQVTGCPVLTFNVGGLPEGIKHGVTGIVIPEVSQEGLTSALRALVSSPNLLKKMSRESLRHQRPRFTIDATADRYQALCANLMAVLPRETAARI